jgi:redox-sensitive bicupin YhaK (pirin superfamily)
MNQTRTVEKIITGEQTVDGAGVRLVRVIGRKDTKEFDPFLMLDAFDSRNPLDYIKGFPWHPHRGIETITYLIQGDIEHGDSLGNTGSILDGECQWMTAGSGIIHQEMPKASERMLGVQLWLNLPAADKMTAPMYHGITKAEMPLVDEKEVQIRVIAGTYKETAGARAGDFVKPLLLDVDMNAGAVWTLRTDPGASLFIYIFQGEGAVGERGETAIAAKQAVLFSEGALLQVKAAKGGMRFLLAAGRALREPIAWGGPIVMNTQEELDTAFRELKNDTFIK